MLKNFSSFFKSNHVQNSIHPQTHARPISNLYCKFTNFQNHNPSIQMLNYNEARQLKEEIKKLRQVSIQGGPLAKQNLKEANHLEKILGTGDPNIESLTTNNIEIVKPRLG